MWVKSTKNGLTFWDTTKGKHTFKPIHRHIAEHTDSMFLLAEKEPDKYTTVHGSMLSIYEESKEGEGTLPSGVYKLEDHYNGPLFYEYKTTTTEELLPLSGYDSVINEYNNFINNADIYKQLKLKYKKSIMLYGPPGTGKTSFIHKIVDNLDKENTLIIFTDTIPPQNHLNEYKKDPRLKLFIFEEFTNTLQKDYDAPLPLLDFLDGESSIENCFIVATTNYPEKLPKNIADRPGRFDTFYKIGYLTSEDIKTYLNHFQITDVPETLTKHPEMTIAALKELVLQVKRDKLEIADILHKMELHKELIKSEFTKKKRVGFSEN